MSLLLRAERALAEDAENTGRAVQVVFERTEQRESCDDYTALKRPYFGDTHVHTALSQDASTQGTRIRPDGAYRFAKGERVDIQPFDEQGNSVRSQQISQPLDFAAITDHSELYGEVRICNTPELAGYDNWVCKVYRHFPRVAFYLMNARASFLDSRWGYCGEGGEHCLEQAAVVWQEVQSAAEQAYDRSSACRFTSFNAYEWTGLDGPTGQGNMHRNVLFRNEIVPAAPISALDGRQTDELWSALEEQCLDSNTGCDALVIPHNSNMSGGQMMSPLNYRGEPVSKSLAQQRARLEPLIEIMQHKGSSECFRGAYGEIAEDEYCAFEFLSQSNMSNPGAGEPGPDNGYFREGLRDGLRVEQRVGVNPFKFGVIASTDTHLGIPGAVEEDRFQGGGGAGKSAMFEVPAGLPDNPEYNPGGLAVVWAEENSRDALFNGMRRKETYGTSGPRMELRFFGGWDLESDLCETSDMVQTAYQRAVPMGGDLNQIGDDRSPAFLVAALRDAQQGEPLHKVQIIKGWVDDDGRSHERVFDVATAEEGAIDVDLQSCGTSQRGPGSICTVWQDPDFDAGTSSYYYTRVLQNPSCRWSQQICVAEAVDCNNPASIGDGLDYCCSAEHRPVVQERAWSSPIWYRARP